jgi:N-formylglutamate amidohydrolase
MPLPYELDQRKDRPKICLGTDSFHTPSDLRDLAARSFAAAGLEAGFDRPFSGALVPAKHFHTDRRVHALMVEVRRDLYLDEATGSRHPGYEPLRARLIHAVRELRSSWIAM